MTNSHFLSWCRDKLQAENQNKELMRKNLKFNHDDVCSAQLSALVFADITENKSVIPAFKLKPKQACNYESNWIVFPSGIVTFIVPLSRYLFFSTPNETVAYSAVTAYDLWSIKLDWWGKRQCRKRLSGLRLTAFIRLFFIIELPWNLYCIHNVFLSFRSRPWQDWYHSLVYMLNMKPASRRLALLIA